MNSHTPLSSEKRSNDIAANPAVDIPSDESVVVFLVDDQPMIGEAVRRFLADDPNIVFHYCSKASDALALAEAIKPTVILQDLVMPEIDGLTLVGLYRANPATRDIPVIVLSSKEDAAVKSECFASDVSDYLVKLPDKIELIARIKHQSKAYINRLQRDAAYVALTQSQQKLIEMNEALERLSHVDGLTGLSNRRYLDQFLDTEWRRACRERTDISVLMIDVDNFKKYNDNFGHLSGDEVLKQVAIAMQSCLSRPGDLAARFGGEEFVGILPRTDLAGAQVIGDRICKAVESLQVVHGADGAGPVITVSIGGASAKPIPDSLPHALLSAADEALYDAKRRGKNRAAMRVMTIVVAPSASCR